MSKAIYRNQAENAKDLMLNEKLSSRLNNSLSIIKSKDELREKNLQEILNSINEFSESLSEFGLKLTCKLENKKSRYKNIIALRSWKYYIKYKAKKKFLFFNYIGYEKIEIISLHECVNDKFYFSILERYLTDSEVKNIKYVNEELLALSQAKELINIISSHLKLINRN